MATKDPKVEATRLRAQMEAKLAEAQTLQAEWEGKTDPMPAEVSEKVTKALGEFDAFKAQLDLANRVAAGDDFMNTPGASKTAGTDWRQAAPGEGDAPVDEKSWREIEVKSVRVDPFLGVPIVESKTVRYHVPLTVQKKGYQPAFENYLRKGMNDLGPQDRKTLSEGTDSAGGFLVPEDYQTELIKKIATNATIRSRARVGTTSRDIAKWPKIHYTTDDKYTSGVRVTWTGESPTSSTVHRVTDPVFGLYSIPVHTCMASLPLYNDLIEDSAFDVVGVSSELLAEAFTLGENDTFINGSGIGRPMGILTQVDGDGPASVASGTAATLTADGLINLAYALPAQYEANAAWVFRKATEQVIRKLKDSSKNYLWPVISSMGNFAPAPKELLGFPTLRDEFMPAIADSAYPIIFGDLRGYLVLDRVGISVQRLSEIYAETNITLLLARKRLGGQTIEPWRMKVQKVSA